MLAGGWAAAIAAVACSPYRLRLRYDRGTLRSYWSFSWPLFVSASGGMLMALAALTAANIHLGLAGAGAMTLGANISAFTNRVDVLVTNTLYPAICAAAERVEVLRESFVKSNRLALMWGVPFGFALTLFAPDLVRFLLGQERWQGVVVLLQAYGVVAAVDQIGFNWDAYMRARGDTKPLAISALWTTVAFLVTAIPLLFLFDLPGFAVGVGVQMVVNLAFRAYYLGRLFEGFAFLVHVSRAVLPVLPATALVLTIRLAESGARGAATAAAELLGFIVVSAVATWLLERPLLRETVSYLRARRPAVSASG
jgi:O-antigen/teichoic acid export membrane protein